MCICVCVRVCVRVMCMCIIYMHVYVYLSSCLPSFFIIAGRSVRSVVKQRYIELLVVADYTTLQWHAGQDVESYIVTLIDLVCAVFD